MGEPLRTTPGKRMGCSQLLLHGPCGPGPTPPRTTRIQSCRGASSLPRSPIRLPHKTGYPKGRDKPMNGAAVIAEILKREGTEFLSCYPRNPLIEACAALDIRPILCRQERVGVGMADGYTRIRRGKRNGVFAAQAGPGIENAFPGVAQAYTENVPMLVIPAGLPLARQYVRPVFRAADVYRPVTKWSALAHAVEELPDLMRRAYHAMRSGKGGPVMVEIPNEIFEAEYAGALDYAPVPVQRMAPDPDAVKAAVRALLAAKHPLLLASLKEEIAAAKKAWLAEWSKQLDSEEMPINQYRVIRDLLRSVDRDNVIITHDSGSPREQLIPFWETTAAGSYMGWGKSTQLGYGLGITMGAKLAAPDKLCVNIMGDAAIGMTGMDIETAARNRIAILTVVFNNGVMAAERDVLKVSDQKYGAMAVGGNYTKVAEGLNVAATRVEKPAHIVPAIKDAVRVTESGAPFLLEIVVKEGYDFSRYPLAGL